jgi:hypothetical protein
VNKLALKGNKVVEFSQKAEDPKSRHFHVIGGKTADWLRTEVTVTL